MEGYSPFVKVLIPPHKRHLLPMFVERLTARGVASGEWRRDEAAEAEWRRTLTMADHHKEVSMTRPSIEEALEEFDYETTVERAFFTAVSATGPEGVDGEALYQAARTLTEAAEKLLAVARAHQTAQDVGACVV